MERSPLWEPYEVERKSKRGAAHGFTRKSRKRFLQLVASLSHAVLPLFVTLTYPARWPDEWNFWKSHLQTLWKRMLYEWPKASAVWKLEPQKRGAPDFHLIVWGIPFLPKEWLARAWFEVVGSKEAAHLAAGTSVERARSFRGVMCYAGKEVPWKRSFPACWLGLGWPVLRRARSKGTAAFPRLGIYDQQSVGPSFARLVRRYFASKGKTWRSRNGVTLYTQGHLQWSRAVDWAETGDCQPIDFSVPIMAQPF